MRNSRVHASDCLVILKQNIVQLVAFFICLQVNEEISKIENIFKNIDKFFYTLTDKPLLHKRLVLSAELIHGTFKNTCVKCPGLAPGYANAQPPGRDKIANVPLRD